MLRKIVSAGLMVGYLISGCSNRAPTYPVSGSPPPSTVSSLAGTSIRGGEMQALTARGVVDALDKAGFLVPHPQDATSYDCATAGCDQSIVTDTVRVKSFPTTGRAEIYAADHGLDQVETIVVAFAPQITQAEHDRYWTQIQKLMH